jgi:hypothetical protein
MQRTSVAVDRDTALDLHQIAVDLGRQEQRQVTLLEVIRLLIEAWQQRQQAGVTR